MFYHSNGVIKMATELAMFDLVYHLNRDSMSKSVILFDHDMQPLFVNSFLGNQELLDDVDNLYVNQIEKNSKTYLSVSFNYTYSSKIILKDRLSKLVYVSLEYELPLNN